MEQSGFPSLRQVMDFVLHLEICILNYTKI